MSVLFHRFQEMYGDSVHTAGPYAMNTEFSEQLAREMVRYRSQSES